MSNVRIRTRRFSALKAVSRSASVTACLLAGGLLVAPTVGCQSMAETAEADSTQTQDVGVGVQSPKGATQLSVPISEHFLALSNNEALTSEWGAGEDGVLTITGGAKGVKTKDQWGDFRLHIEWFSPPGGQGQLAGNSGVFLQGIYEMQVLGSAPAPHEPKINEAGAIYNCKVPNVNAATGPGTWQAYDVEFTAARVDADGNKTSKATITAWLNGQLIHQDVPVEGGTSGGYPNDREKNLKVVDGKLVGPLMLQDHVSHAEGPVQFRNIWIKPIAE